MEPKKAAVLTIFLERIPCLASLLSLPLIERRVFIVALDLLVVDQTFDIFEISQNFVPALHETGQGVDGGLD
jgi:hypothetical protein